MGALGVRNLFTKDFDFIGRKRVTFPFWRLITEFNCPDFAPDLSEPRVRLSWNWNPEFRDILKSFFRFE
jgi:hypothetical protein